MIRAYIQQLRVGFSAPTYRLIVDGEEMLRLVNTSEISMFLDEHYPDAVVIKEGDRAKWIETGIEKSYDPLEPYNSEIITVFECTHCGAKCEDGEADERCKCPKGFIKLRIKKELRRAS